MFEEEGIVRVKRESPEIIVELDSAFRHAKLLSDLLIAMGPGAPSVIRRVETVKHDNPAHRLEQTWNAGEPARLPFGTRLQAAVLIAVGRGPATARGIADEIGVSKHSVRGAVDVLETHGLVITTTDGRGRYASRWVTLNDMHPIAASLKKYVLALPSSTTARRRLPPRKLPSRRPVRTAELPGARELRTAILLEVARVGQSSPAAIAKRLSVPGKAVVKWARDLDAAGLIRYGERRGRETLEMFDVAESSAGPLEALLSATRNFVKAKR